MNNKVVNDINNNGKKEQVRNIFDTIAVRYDFLDHVMTLCIDQVWRRKAVKMLKGEKPSFILDIATGTGDVAIKEARILKPEKIIGIDISQNMLEVGKKKIKSKKLDHIISLELGDSENLNFENNKFDAVSVAFGVRNFENLEIGLKEIHRVIKKDGKVLILEFSIPKNRMFKNLYMLYFNRFVPLLGGLLTKSKIAYKYLPGSVNSFPYGEKFAEILKGVGFKDIIVKPLSFGICTVYYGIK